MQFTHDIIIVGAGIVGSVLACSLAESTPLRIALLERNEKIPQWSAAEYALRVSALSLSSQQFLAKLNLWQAIAQARMSPFEQIKIWQGQQAIQFDSAEIARATLGSIVENNLLLQTVHEKIQKLSTQALARLQFFSAVELSGLVREADGIVLQTRNEHIFKAPLIVAADGARSWIREQTNIQFQQHNYHQQAIVANVQVAVAHQKIARQIFLPTGPLAFLPLLPENVTSIVWTLPQAVAQANLQKTTEEFSTALQQAIAGSSMQQEIGSILAVSERAPFNLFSLQAEKYYAPHVVLIGDAAHQVHPLAGLGLNMGLADARRLTTFIQEACAKQKMFYHPTVLQQYARCAKAENAKIMLTIDGIKTLFSDKKIWQTPAALGMRMVQYSSILKKFFMQQAVG